MLMAESAIRGLGLRSSGTDLYSLLPSNYAKLSYYNASSPSLWIVSPRLGLSFRVCRRVSQTEILQDGRPLPFFDTRCDVEKVFHT